MTSEEKAIQHALGTYLPSVWKETCRLRAESGKLWAEGRKLGAGSGKLLAECYTFQAEGKKLFTDAVTEVYGSNIIEWTGYGCIVDNMEFRYDN